ncbi:MAG: histidinol-phosphatase HisJ family protein [Bacillota bacterium]
MEKVADEMLPDYHIHTNRCGHATGTDCAYVERGLALGLTELGFADHCPLYYRIPEGFAYTARGMTDLEEYVRSIEALRRKFHPFPIRIGLEVDFLAGQAEPLLKMLGDLPFDYLIGSVHFVPEWSYGYITNYRSRPPLEVYQRYYRIVREMAASGLFQIIGHLDLPRRIAEEPQDESLALLEEELATAIAGSGMTVEINTSGWRLGLPGGGYPALRFLQRLAAKGVPITFGSDAHRPQEVGSCFEEALAHARAAGYREYAIFAGKQRRMMSLP